MKISHQNPGSSLDWEVQAPLVVETPSGDMVHIARWSLAGLEWPQEAPVCPETGTLSVPFQGVDIRFPVRLSRKNDAAPVVLEGLSGRQRETLALFYRSLLSGRMASSGDVITSLDTPVDLVPMEETEEEAAASRKRALPRPLRVVLHSVAYVGLACAVVGFLGHSIFKSIDSIDVQHGRVKAPINQALPAREGFVERIEVVAGQVVKEGDLLITLRNPENDAKLTQARAQIEVEQAAQEQVRRALKTLQDLDPLTELDVRRATAERLYIRHVRDRGFDAVWKQWIALPAALRETPEQTQVANPFAFAIARLKDKDAQFRADIKGLKGLRDAHREIIAQNVVRAPSDGIVREVLVRPGQPFGAQDTDLIFETAAPRVTMGWVSEKLAETIFIGMPATIGFNEQGRKVEVAGAVIDVQAGGDPRRPGEFGIIVTIAATELSAAETKARLRPGAPVNLETKRQLFSGLITAIKGWGIGRG